MKYIKGSVTAPKGFLASGLWCGIRRSGKHDLTLIYSERPCSAAGAFTSNKVQASCVVLDRERLKGGKAQAVIVNSGNANCMTGKRGFADSRTMAAAVARALGIPEQSVCMSSTGLIGKPLPIQKIVAALPELVGRLSVKGSSDAARGILTTDRVKKEVAVELMLGGRRVRFGAIAKGAGMVHPTLAVGGMPQATMLCFTTTDAAIAPAALRAALAQAVRNTFNMITVDGDMSTNDSVIVLANGMAGNRAIRKGTADFERFVGALESVFLSLAKMMIKDAEGATKFVTISVTGAASEKDARMAARTIASSTLAKCAFFGSDPNWGRIAAAVGRSGARVDPWKLRVYLGRTLVVRNGGTTEADPRRLRSIFTKKDIGITVDLGLGRFDATAYTCDLSTSYVEFNSAYHT